ncbi:hypothetical protein SteCoe_8057 [Stentor coeruleus]|uniref:Uncharacterized protein n=1 Tax=Stentor coeruleus TaxID=5963 RepID=A0A1R2CKZ9_9CILI|nr:hypothetical protein SteCoe_8057 [Stentor coeruleus]
MIGILLLLALGESIKILSPQEIPVQTEKLTTAVGTNCGYTNIYYIYGVDVTPWPPTPGTSALVSMGGMFLMNALVQNVVYSSLIDGIITTEAVAVNNDYIAGEEVIFEIAIVFPTYPGTYTSSIMLEGAGLYLCCWAYNYIIY